MNDVTIYASDHTLKVKGSTSVTVLWVTIKINTTGEFSKDNSRIAIIAEHRGNKLTLGKDITIRSKDDGDHFHFGFALETEGTVFPNDFTTNLIFRRDAATMKKNKESGKYAVSEKFRQKLGIITKEVVPPGGQKAEYPDDTGESVFRDDIPPKIYDYDEPGPVYVFKKTPSDDEYVSGDELKQYFRIFVAYKDEERCSDIVAYEIEHKINFRVNTNVNSPTFEIFKHESNLNINSNNANNENDFYNNAELNP
jgi:hypothetical protein